MAHTIHHHHHHHPKEETMTVTLEIQELKAAHRATWASGDYAAVAEAFVREVGRTAVAKAAIQPGTDVLDVATGSGNAAIPAALAGARVTGLDLVPELLDAGAALAQEAGVDIEWVEGDAEALPFPDERFDTVLSVVGVQFAPRHEVTARELARVIRPGGKLVLASWTLAGFIGQIFKTMGPYLPKPPAGATPPPLWGDADHVRNLFEDTGVKLAFEKHFASFYADSPAAFVEYMADHYGPMLKARARLAAEGRWDALRADLVALSERANVAEDGFLARSEYLLAVGHKRV
jgi:SAM-dependent methyltransferase